jgi:multicomponent Na+:H+ antiporter subunit D
MTPHTLVYPIAVPLLAAAILAALSRRLGRRVSSIVSLAVTTLVILDGAMLLREASLPPLVYWSGGWTPRNGIAIGIALFADPVSAALVLLIAVLVAASFFFSYRYFDAVGTLFHVLLLVFLGAMCGFALAGDLFTLIVFLELMSVCAYALCAYKTDEAASLEGALNFAFTNTIGACILILGLGLLYARTGALNLAQIGRALDAAPADDAVKLAFALVSSGLLIKAATVPFHFWLADAHAVAPTPVSILFSGVMVELGLYGIARIYWTVFHHALEPVEAQLRTIFVGAGVATVLIGGVMCLDQFHLKRLLAFSTISHMGVMLAAFGLFDARALGGAAIYLLGHAAAKSSLFLCAGIVLHRLRQIDTIELQGRGRRIRSTGVILAIAAAGLAGAPGTAMALGTEGIEGVARELQYGWLKWIFAAGSILTAAAVVGSGVRIFTGYGARPQPAPAPRPIRREEPETKGGHRRAPIFMWAPSAALAVCAFALALLPHLSDRASAAAALFTDTDAYRAIVLDSRPVVFPPAQRTDHAAGVVSWLNVLFAFGFGAFLCTRAGARSAAVLKGPPFLRGLHSGRIGDYACWIAAGAAGFAIGIMLAR